jgi:hypothetical protein
MPFKEEVRSEDAPEATLEMLEDPDEIVDWIPETALPKPADKASDPEPEEEPVEPDKPDPDKPIEPEVPVELDPEDPPKNKLFSNIIIYI